MSAAKMGRPTNNPRIHKLSARVSDHTKKVLDAYCEQENVSQTEAIERGIEKLSDDLKK